MANYSAPGTALFHLALRLLPVFWVYFIFYCPSFSLLTAAQSLSAVLHQSLLKPHNFMFTLRVTVKIFFLGAIFFSRQKMLKTADKTFKCPKSHFKKWFNENKQKFHLRILCCGERCELKQIKLTLSAWGKNGNFSFLQVKNPIKDEGYMFTCGFSKLHNSKIGLQLTITFITV